jgi:gliding motility-associated-like protein
MGNRRLVILILGIILSLRCSIGQTLPDACAGSRVRYSVQGLPNSTFAWNVQGGSILISYNDSVDIQWDSKNGTYQLSVTEVTVNNCTGPVNLATVKVGGDTANLGGNQSICLGDFATFSPDKPFNKYHWSDGDSLSFIKTGIPGIVWVEVTNSAGCVSRDSANLKVNQLTAINLGIDREVCDSNIILTGPDSASYNWMVNGLFSSSAQTIEITRQVGVQVVSLQIVDKNGCTNSDTVKMLECVLGNNLGIMNTITANHDNVNDLWIIKNIGLYPNAVISLYDRWGRLVFKQVGNYQNDFDGKNLPMDSYFYVIDLKNGSKPITGYLLIIR